MKRLYKHILFTFILISIGALALIFMGCGERGPGLPDPGVDAQATDEQIISYTGEELNLGFNCRYFIETLQVMECEKVNVYINNTGDSFTEDITISLTELCLQEISWSDFDLDGDLDFLMTAFNIDYEPVTKLYWNVNNEFIVSEQKIINHHFV